MAHILLPFASHTAVQCSHLDLDTVHGPGRWPLVVDPTNGVESGLRYPGMILACVAFTLFRTAVVLLGLRVLLELVAHELLSLARLELVPDLRSLFLLEFHLLVPVDWLHLDLQPLLVEMFAV